MIYYGGLEAMWSGNNYKLKNNKISLQWELEPHLIN